jgi:hypothetical protein
VKCPLHIYRHFSRRLVCNVSYKNPEGEKKFFRKFFKFVVYKPLDIKTVVRLSLYILFLASVCDFSCWMRWGNERVSDECRL